MPGASLSPSASELQRLLSLRLGGQSHLQQALVEALFGQPQVSMLDAAQRRRLLCLLEARDDEALAAVAWRGDPGRSVLHLRLDILLDGMATPSEHRRIRQHLASLLTAPDGLPLAVAVRSVLVSDDEV